jgi:DNA-binding NtrC family response regulator
VKAGMARGRLDTSTPHLFEIKDKIDPMRVLLVDDEIEYISAMAERLEMRGISVKWATSAEAAMAIVAESCFDIAVLDVKMPQTGGLELMPQIKAKCPDTSFIFLSGQGSEETFQRVADECADARYLIKPVNLATLIDEMNRITECRSESKTPKKEEV